MGRVVGGEDGSIDGSEPLVRITARDIYNAVQDLDVKVEALAKLSVVTDDHEARIRKLEFKWFGIMAGLTTLFGGALGVLISKAVGH